MEHNISNDTIGGQAATGVCMAITAIANVMTIVGQLSELAHLIAMVTAIGAACTTMAVGFLRFKN
jgi:hypothetical protein